MKVTPKRLYIFTGKGGVGKTTLSMAMTKYLESQGRQVKYNSFFQDPEKSLWNSLRLPVLDMDLISSAEIYIGRKLKSEMIASWIMKTHFFKSLFQMIPGLGHMILLGHIIDELEKNPELTIIMDSPASRHALTMFESSSNFKKIFRAGLIVKDIERMHSFLGKQENLQVNVINLPTELAINEAQDLIEELNKNSGIGNLHTQTITNDSFLKFLELNNLLSEPLPDFLQKKIELEKKLIELKTTVPHIDSIKPDEIITKIAPLMETFL